MTTRPRLIATDLDGTLLGPDAQVSPRTAAALRAANREGIEVVAVTGRSHHTAIERLEPIQVFRHAVCSNGATRYDLAAGRLVAAHPIDPGHLVAIVERVSAGLPGAGFGLETSTGFVYDDAFLRHLPELRQRGHRPGLVPPAHGGEVLKVMVGHPEVDRDELLLLVDGLVPSEVTVSSSGAPFLEITAAGVDKAFGLAAVCGELGIVASEVLAFGDGLNDLPMLSWAGRSVAMGNAHPTVAATATDRTARHDDDGVAVYLERLLERL